MDYPVKKQNVIHFATQIKKFEFARNAQRVAKKIESDISTINGDESIDDIINLVEMPLIDFLRNDDTGQKPEKLGIDIDEYIEYLIENKFIKMDTREGKSILKKLDFKINYYKIGSALPTKEKYNRLSFYYFDKYAIMNLCKIVYNKRKYRISGVYQKNDTSFWFPDLIVYKMDIEEYILFNPHHNLIYDKIIE